MNLLTIKKKVSRRLPSDKKSRWLRLPVKHFGITGIFSMNKPLHPLAELLREAFFNRYGSCGAGIPYDASEHFSSLIYRRWGFWPESLLKPIFERLETSQESDIESCGKFVGWIQKQIENEIGFRNYIVGVGTQTVDELLFDAAIEQARGSPNERFHPAVWEAANNLPEKIKAQARKEAALCQDTYRSPISNSSKSLTGRSDKNGRAAIKSSQPMAS